MFLNMWKLLVLVVVGVVLFLFGLVNVEDGVIDSKILFG